MASAVVCVSASHACWLRCARPPVLPSLLRIAAARSPQRLAPGGAGGWRREPPKVSGSLGASACASGRRGRGTLPVRARRARGRVVQEETSGPASRLTKEWGLRCRHAWTAPCSSGLGTPWPSRGDLAAPHRRQAPSAATSPARGGTGTAPLSHATGRAERNRVPVPCVHAACWRAKGHNDGCHPAQRGQLGAPSKRRSIGIHLLTNRLGPAHHDPSEPTFSQAQVAMHDCRRPLRQFNLCCRS